MIWYRLLRTNSLTLSNLIASLLVVTIIPSLHATPCKNRYQKQANNNHKLKPLLIDTEGQRQTFLQFRKFTKELQEWRAFLLPDGQELEKSVAMATKAGNSSLVPNTNHATPITWHPIPCDMAGYMESMFTRETAFGGALGERLIKITNGSREEYGEKTFLLHLYASPDDLAMATILLSHASSKQFPFFPTPLCLYKQQKDGHTDQMGILYEWIGDGWTLWNWIRERAPTIDDIVRLTAQIVGALEYIHRLGFIHAQLSPDSVLVNTAGDLFFVNFGFALPTEKAHLLRKATPPNIPPELAHWNPKEQANESIDWWSLGNLIATLYSYQIYPINLNQFNPSLQKQHKTNILPTRYVPVQIDPFRTFSLGAIPMVFPKELKQLIYLLLDPNPENRSFNTPNKLNVLKSLAYFKGITWKSLEKMESAKRD